MRGHPGGGGEQYKAAARRCAALCLGGGFGLRRNDCGLALALRAEQYDRGDDADETEGGADPELKLEAVGQCPRGRGPGIDLR